MKNASKLEYDITVMPADERLALARDVNTSPDILIKLAYDKNFFVNLMAIQNPNMPIQTLEIFAALVETSSHIQSYFANLNLFKVLNKKPMDKLIALSNSKNRSIRITVASDKITPPEILHELSKDEDKYIRDTVACNPNTSLETLIELSRDKYEHVRNCAKVNRINRIGLLK